MPFSVLKVPMIVTNHTYETQSFIPQTKLSKGEGLLYASTNVLVLRKKQLKDKHIKTIISFEEKTIKKNIEVEKRRQYYYNKRYDKLNPPIKKKEKELFLII